MTAPLHPRLAAVAEALVRRFGAIPNDRKAKLDAIAAWIVERRATGLPAALMFICTHNARRSQMGQLWAAAAAAFYAVPGLSSCSGGTEVTAVEPRALAALQGAGFAVSVTSGGQNPRYAISYADGAPAQIAWSKRHDDESNPTRDFAAILTCGAADVACPTVAGAALRLALPYPDPKLADGTPDEAASYDERCAQIGTEMLYLVSRVAH